MIITVGRIFSEQKNTELFLDIVSSVDLKDWKVLLAGPLESGECDGALKAEAFFKEKPDLRGKVEFCGNIADPFLLRAMLLEAKVFLLTSRYEGFSVALIEAAASGNYIISTDVGCAEEIVCGAGNGFVLPRSREGEQDEDAVKTAAAAHLRSIIDGGTDASGMSEAQAEYIFKNYAMSNIVKNKCFTVFFNASLRAN
ncbi:MAG: glycosyltransferase [Spirochaetaceae bacterium]|nr:glycosyltransferase [Spirochaetaceae bacterium]